MPQTAADLLYLETVAEECAAADGGTGRCRAILDRLVPGIPDDQHPRDLSEGQRLALALAIVLSGEPRVLLLDEPTRGLDYAAKHALAGILRELADDGHAVLVATHDVEFVAQVADDVVVLAEGEVVSSGPVRRVVAESPAFAPQVTKVLGPPWLRVDEVAGPAGGAVSATHRAVALTPRSALVLLVASVTGLMMLAWPLLLQVEDATRVDPPFLFLALLPLVIAVVLAEVSEGGLDPRVLAILGVLSAVNAILRGISAGTGGVELVFFLLILAGRVFGPGLRVRARLHVAVRVGADDRRASAPGCRSRCWCAAWVGMGAGLLPRRVTGRAEIAMLVVYGVVAAYAFGLLMNLSGWPFIARHRGGRPRGLAVLRRRRAGRGEPAPVPASTRC